MVSYVRIQLDRLFLSVSCLTASAPLQSILRRTVRPTASSHFHIRAGPVRVLFLPK